MSRNTSPASIEITASWTRNGLPGCSIRLRMPGELKRHIMLLTAVLVLAGCNTMEGLGKDIQKGGEKLEKAANK